MGADESKETYIILLIAFSIVGWLAANASSKTQSVRVFDILLYGPYLVWLAFQDETYVLSPLEKIFILFLGATTITYNARNWVGLNKLL